MDNKPINNSHRNFSSNGNQINNQNMKPNQNKQPVMSNHQDNTGFNQNNNEQSNTQQSAPITPNRPSKTNMNTGQTPTKPSNSKPKKHLSLLQKAALIGAVCGLLGGVVAYGGSSYIENHTTIMNSTQVPSGSNSAGTVTRSNSKNVENQSEQAFKSVRPAVVSVINMQKQQANPLAALLGIKQNKGSLQAASEGSGVIYKIHGNSAYLVTNNHVVSGSSKLKVILSSGRKISANVVGTNKSDDLAVVKVNSSSIHNTASFGNSKNIQTGETALAIGSPLGSTYASTLTQGIISNTNRKIAKVQNNQKVGSTHVIQTDAAINPGNSGGALVNLNGQVVGINSAKVATTGQGTSVQGMGFAIPSNKVTHDINKIIANNK